MVTSTTDALASGETIVAIKASTYDEAITELVGILTTSTTCLRVSRLCHVVSPDLTMHYMTAVLS